uniref:DUF6817 domain-containing protein n=1 Tax=Corethron hystrix TaxID=216773 RepID=A0A7S1BC29_9STRA
MPRHAHRVPLSAFALFLSFTYLHIHGVQAYSTSVASKYKAPDCSTPAHVAESWVKQDAALLDFVGRKVPAVLDHTGATAFDEHLKGVQGVMRKWNASEHLVSAGLFHSIYGTEGFQGFCLPLSERDAIKDLIGPKAERMCWIFCMVDRFSVDQTVFEWLQGRTDRETYIFRSRPELGRFEISLSRDEWLDFIELTLGDWLEQVEGAAQSSSALFLWGKGEAYAYRRDAYHAMSKILSMVYPERLGTIVPSMVHDIYETEQPETRNLVQPRTPPMSDAAKRALEALRSAGEEIPKNMAPIPRDALAIS